MILSSKFGSRDEFVTQAWSFGIVPWVEARFAGDLLRSPSKRTSVHGVRKDEWQSHEPVACCESSVSSACFVL
jgi:hypothetical protein